ncbi:MAG: DNA primase [Enterobacteriaceae bacterium PC38]|nr:MAG: DNA primase [Enterobacteriaceae bacterium PC38]
MKKISKNFIKKLIHITNLIDLINKRINVIKKGKYYVTLCPFHNEKTPSFTINNDKQYYYCFGCNNYGNAIDFLMKYEKLTFIESIKELSIINGINIVYENKFIENKNIINEKEELYKLMEKINILYQKNLWSKKGKNVIHYLKNRGLTENTIKKFSLGFSLYENNNILNNFNNNKKNIELLEKIGIIIIKKKKIYERFRYRIMFPIKNKNKKIIGFGGRTINNNIPKYLNTPETEIFHKSKNLYGLYKLINKNNIKFIIIVEGYFDYIMLKQNKIDYVVALLGTFIKTYQIKILFNITKVIIFCYDGDLAGNKASWYSLKKCIPYINDNKQIKFIFLPNNKDPDTLIKKEGKEKFYKRINNAISFSDFLFKKISSNLDLNNIYDKIKFSINAINLISKIQGYFLKINLRKILSIKLGLLDDTQLQYWVKINTKKKERKKIKKTNMRNIISLLLQNPRLYKFIPSIEKLKKIKKKIPGLNLFIELLNIINTNSNVSTGQLLEFYRDKKFNKIVKILSKQNILLTDDKLIEKNFLINIINFLNLIIKKKISKMIINNENLKLEQKKEINLLNNIILKDCNI